MSFKMKVSLSTGESRPSFDSPHTIRLEETRVWREDGVGPFFPDRIVKMNVWRRVSLE